MKKAKKKAAVVVAFVVMVLAGCESGLRSASPDTGVYRAPDGTAHLAVDGVDKGRVSWDEHGTEVFGLVPLSGALVWSNDHPVDSIILGTAQSKQNPYCKNGKLVVVWEGNRPTRDGDACVWMCGP